MRSQQHTDLLSANTAPSAGGWGISDANGQGHKNASGTSSNDRVQIWHLQYMIAQIPLVGKQQRMSTKRDAPFNFGIHHVQTHKNTIAYLQPHGKQCTAKGPHRTHTFIALTQYNREYSTTRFYCCVVCVRPHCSIYAQQTLMENYTLHSGLMACRKA